ncbi:hypothetical protein SAMN05216418_1872 [Microbacterium enclense]|uniref:Uncharacterized protein n=1 Tax=Microbacterium enclense TaxID=993073 RepID=A0A1G6K723_9MICO|nr:hypothetical protein SAMN05216418_1872 [Microbacterium enclense]
MRRTPDGNLWSDVGLLRRLIRRRVDPLIVPVFGCPSEHTGPVLCGSMPESEAWSLCGAVGLANERGVGGGAKQ